MNPDQMKPADLDIQSFQKIRNPGSTGHYFKKSMLWELVGSLCKTLASICLLLWRKNCHLRVAKVSSLKVS